MNTSLQFTPLAMDQKDPLGDSVTASTPLIQRPRRRSQQELVAAVPPLWLEAQHYLLEGSD